MTLLFLMNLGLAGSPVAAVAIRTPSRNRILYVGQRNNAIIVPPRQNVLYVPPRPKLIHDF